MFNHAFSMGEYIAFKIVLFTEFITTVKASLRVFVGRIHDLVNHWKVAAVLRLMISRFSELLDSASGSPLGEFTV